MISKMKSSLLVAAALTALLARPAGAADETLLARMSALNPNLHAFTATLHADVTMKSFPFLSAQLAGTYYFKQPDKTKVVFSSGMPLIAEQFDKLYAHIESPSQWENLYVVTVVSDDGSATTFKLVPRKDGNVDHIDAIADDKTATVSSMRWNYKNGGYAQMDNRYGTVDGNTVVTSQTGHVQEPGYVADITSTIDGYKINPSLDDGVFSEQ
jgi:hypothetical protein